MSYATIAVAVRIARAAAVAVARERISVAPLYTQGAAESNYWSAFYRYPLGVVSQRVK
jgi:hypothetical protein